MDGAGILLLAAVFAIYSGVPALAHSWYPRECCHDQDCKPADAVDTDHRGDWSVRVGDLRIWVPKRFEIRVSPDSRAHICYRKDKEFGYMPLCLFLPSGS